jgi:uncharacterized membrane protein
MRVLPTLALITVAPIAFAQGTLSAQEKADFGAQVARCWNMSGLTDAAKRTVVTVAFELNRQGMPQPKSFRLIGAGKDTSDAVKSAYAMAKRAILRCGAKGYELPLEKYELWRNTELTFNPERMSLR